MASTSQQIGHDRPPHWRDREGTWDRRIFKEVVQDDEYGLPASFSPLDVVMDIGAHLGSFSWACLTRGAGLIFAYEVDCENFQLLEWNLRNHGHAVYARNVAIWRSDLVDHALFCTYDSTGANNTGAVRVHNYHGHPVPGVMTFDSAIREAANTSANGRIRLAKLDVEGSEYPILYTATGLELIDELVGEYHALSAAEGKSDGLPPFTVDKLSAYLRRRGFAVSWAEKSRDDPGFGIFRARRLPTM